MVGGQPRMVQGGVCGRGHVWQAVACLPWQLPYGICEDITSPVHHIPMRSTRFSMSVKQLVSLALWD